MKDKIDKTLAPWPHKPILIKEPEEKKALFAEADIALVASGTITLELGLSGIPSVCAYRLSRIEEALFKLLQKTGLANIGFIHLVNLVLGKNALPELVRRDGQKLNPQAIASQTLALLANPPTQAIADFNQKLETPKPPSAMAAEKILNLIGP